MYLSTKKLVLMALCMIFTSSFIFAQDDMSDVKAQINEMNAEVEKAMLSNNPEYILSLYTDDAISMPSYEPMIKGIEAIKNSIDMQKNSNMKMTKFDLTTTDIFGSGDLIVEVGTYILSLEMEGSPEPIDDHGKYLTLYEKQDDGSLKIKLDTWNTDVNPWMDMDHDMDMKDMNNDMKENKMEGTDKN